MRDDTTHPARDHLGRPFQPQPRWLRWIHPAPPPPPTATEGELLFGRGSEVDIVLSGPEVSRVHARLTVTRAAATLEDLGSRNGIRVDGRAVSQVALEVGQLVRIGDHLALIEDGEQPDEFRELLPGYFGGTALESALRKIRRVAPSTLPVIICGRTGCGKERVARAVHDWSGRTGKFVATNCAALTDSLTEAQLFGHIKGAFTGAVTASRGLLRESHGGTLFLDEVGDLSLAAQAKLLRALESGEVVPVGESRPEKVDLRIVVATQVPLERLVAEERFRPDLYARLEGLPVFLPSLRERRGDILHLFAAFTAEFGGGRAPPPSPNAAEALCNYAWPMNIRELRRLCERLVLTDGREPEFELESLPERIRDSLQPSAGETACYDPTTLRALMERHEGNISRVAAELGMSRQRLYRQLARLEGLDIEELRRKPPQAGNRDPD